MNSGIEKRLLLVWLGLSLISALQLWLSSSNDKAVLEPSFAITFSVIAMALIKVRFIVREFMETRHAPPLFSNLTDLWLLLTGVMLIGIYLAGGALN